MEKKNINKFTPDRLKKQIKLLNELIEKTPNEEEKEKNDEMVKKKIEFINNYAENITNSDNKTIIEFMNNLLLLSNTFYKTNGDEIADKIWQFYDDKHFIIHSEQKSPNRSDFFLNLFFLNNPKAKIITDNNLFIDFEDSLFNKFNQYKDKLGLSDNIDNNMEKQIEHKNFLLDIIIYYIYSKVELRSFYTALSTFLVTTKSSVMLLYKTLSLFALSFLKLENKENHLPSLLYVIGGVLRDHARSYLKTKGILQENLSYHECKKHVFNIFILET